MTAEQEKQVAGIRKKHEIIKAEYAAGRLGVQGTSFEQVAVLLPIIDDLQKQQPKRFTEAQLRTAFEQQCDKGKILESFVTPDGKYVRGLSVYAKTGWMACARFLGMIKTEGES